MATHHKYAGKQKKKKKSFYLPFMHTVWQSEIFLKPQTTHRQEVALHQCFDQASASTLHICPAGMKFCFTSTCKTQMIQDSMISKK